jgi:hypothetical protein
MAVIDEDGRLFGVVNVVDALVVLLVVAVLAAGIALVNPFSAGPTPEVRYATIDLGSQPSLAVKQISAGDTATYPNQPGNLTVTDVYVVPGQDPGTASAIVRTRITGQLVNRTARDAAVFDFADEPLRPGRQLNISTLEYVVNGTVTSVSLSGRSLNVTETSVILDTTAPAATADTLTPGDTMRVAGTTVATVEAVQQYPLPDSNRRQVRVGVTLRTRQQGGETRFGPTRVAIGNALSIRTPESNLTGTIAATDTARLPTNDTPVVLDTTVSADTAAAIETGDEMRVADRPIATVESVRVYPTTDPSQRRLALGVTLETTTRDGQFTFGSRPVRVGTTVPIDTDEYSLSGHILTRGTLTPPGTASTTTAQVELENVPPAVANDVRVGMTETTRGETLARITDKRVENATIIVTSENGEIFAREHPRNKDLTLTVELATRRTADRLQFHGRTLRTDTRVVFDLESVTVCGTVIELQE